MFGIVASPYFQFHLAVIRCVHKVFDGPQRFLHNAPSKFQCSCRNGSAVSIIVMNDVWLGRKRIDVSVSILYQIVWVVVRHRLCLHFVLNYRKGLVLHVVDILPWVYLAVYP